MPTETLEPETAQISAAHGIATGTAASGLIAAISPGSSLVLRADAPRPILAPSAASTSPAPGSTERGASLAEPDGAGATAPTDGPAAPRRFRGTAYTGGIVESWMGPTIIDLDGLEPPRVPLPLFYNHARGGLLEGAANPRAGVIDGISVSSGGDAGSGVVIEGRFLSNPTAAAIVADANEGYPWELSVRVDILALTELAPGASAVINGRPVTGPMSIVSASRLREVSFVELGADPDTSAALLNSRQPASPTPPAPTGATIAMNQTAPSTAAPETANTPAPAVAQAPAPAPTPAATIAQLRALPGASAEFVLSALEKNVSLADAAALLCGELAARLAAAPSALAPAPAAAPQLPTPGIAALSAGGAPAPGAAAAHGTTVTIGRFTMRLADGCRGGDPESDWNNSPALRAHWRDNRRAFLAFAAAQEAAGEPYHVLA